VGAVAAHYVHLGSSAMTLRGMSTPRSARKFLAAVMEGCLESGLATQVHRRLQGCVVAGLLPAQAGTFASAAGHYVHAAGTARTSPEGSGVRCPFPAFVMCTAGDRP
jgi:hypothetical protein